MPMKRTSSSTKAPIQMMVDGRLLRIDEATEAVERIVLQPEKPWHGLPIEFHRGAAIERKLVDLYFPQTLIWYQKCGWTRSHLSSGNNSHDFVTRPGEFILLPAHLGFDRADHRSTATSGMALSIRSSELNQLFPDELRTFNLAQFKFTEDKALENLFSLMEIELVSGCPTGHLYAESLSVALVAYLVQTYASGRLLKTIGSTLSERQVQVVKAYVQANLADELSLVKIASIVHMSPYHFARLFKATVGMTPHSYVMEQRIQEARRLLKTDRSITEIAASTGFSSHTHLATLCRRRFGLSPTELRKR